MGGAVTLRPPEGANLQDRYLTWSFGDKDIAGHNTFVSWVDKGKRCILRIHSHKVVFSPSANERAVNYFEDLT